MQVLGKRAFSEAKTVDLVVQQLLEGQLSFKLIRRIGRGRCGELSSTWLQQSSSSALQSFSACGVRRQSSQVAGESLPYQRVCSSCIDGNCAGVLASAGYLFTRWGTFRRVDPKTTSGEYRGRERPARCGIHSHLTTSGRRWSRRSFSCYCVGASCGAIPFCSFLFVHRMQVEEMG